MFVRTLETRPLTFYFYIADVFEDLLCLHTESVNHWVQVSDVFIAVENRAKAKKLESLSCRG